MDEMLIRGLLFAAMSFSVIGQVSGDRYEPLKRALGLSDSQMSQLQRRSSAAITITQPTPTAQPAINVARRASGNTSTDRPKQAADSLRDRILDHSQRAKLALIENVLDRYDAASQAIVLGLISAQQWPGGSLCYYPIRTYPSEFGLSDSQVRQFEQLQQAAREPLYAQIMQKENHRLELLNSGIRADSLTVVQLVSDISKLRKEAADTKPQRDLALVMLDDGQKAKLAEFETALQLASEGIELGLIPDPPKGEVLCN